MQTEGIVFRHVIFLFFFFQKQNEAGSVIIYSIRIRV